MVTIHKSFIPASNKELRPGYSMDPDFVTIHNTANRSKGADAEMHARYLLNGAGGRQVSWHFTVDDKEIYQHLPTDENGWHAGDGQGNGNCKSIGVEICENEDGDFEKAVANAAWLVRQLMDEHNISIDNVVPHKHWSGKNCPHLLLGRFDDFKAQVSGVKHKPAKQKKTKAKTVKEVEGKQYIHLPETAESWRIYPVDAPPTKGIEKGFLKPSKFGGLTYEILGEKEPDVYVIKSSDFGKGKVYGAVSTGAKITGSSITKAKESNKETLYLPASASSWRVYPTNKAPVKGNEKGFLNPKKFGGLQYEVLGKPQANVVTIKTSDFGKVNIYVGPGTGAKIK
ncbi:peptidoglycan recognition protein family protein [Sediminibacillus halophilus]|uniref:N-acetylmuramoyl-L-alanine amidase n=1 Tax=Sediminibacillus halophilus TaxID=482461 RepID=A0A1G9QTY1_9BACI|nr:N-acetylmuramoyl-L-alanine amidase [Sediminibacillus halophilus]